ncbi:hypothetical protein CVT24_008529 [Panaeolus cyanescens]|uniref:HNH nuclease domain-containing protein n=1 Tax=Panaeolus cyanescens TaxID=181874 RepID=A0A409VKX3_9AGAR|nr:hypothetical protein CVT24_008529 [Panaeolus cyanescens]
MSIPEATPAARINLALASTREARHHARTTAVAPNEDRCIIENKTLAVDLCHVFGRKLSKFDGLMTLFEFWWGMVHRSLNLDTRWNAFYALKTYHKLFDQFKWTLVPQLATLDNYASSFDRNDRMKLAAVLEADTGPHSYIFLPLSPVMQGQAIHFQKEPNPTKPEDFSYIFYPFSSPGSPHLITSHIHPKFLIILLGRAMMEGLIDKNQIPNCEEYKPYMNAIEKIYGQWTKEVTEARMKADSSFAYQGEQDPFVFSTDEEAIPDDPERPEDEDYVPSSYKAFSIPTFTLRSTRLSAKTADTNSTEKGRAILDPMLDSVEISAYLASKRRAGDSPTRDGPHRGSKSVKKD